MSTERPTYRSMVKGSLKQRLEFLATQAPAERRDLKDEIDVARALLMGALAMYDEVTEGDLKDKASSETKVMLANHLNSTLEQTARLVEKLAKVELMSAQMLPSTYVPYLLADIARSLRFHFGEDPRILKALEDIQRMPVRDHKGPVIAIGVD